MRNLKFHRRVKKALKKAGIETEKVWVAGNGHAKLLIRRGRKSAVMNASVSPKLPDTAIRECVRKARYLLQ